MFVRISMLLLSVSATSSFAALIFLSLLPNRALAFGIAFLTAALVAGAAGYLLSSTMVFSSNYLSAKMLGTLSPADRAFRSQRHSIFFSEIAAAWKQTELAWERTLTRQQNISFRSEADMYSLMRMVAKAVEERAPYMRGHADRVAEYSAAIALELGVDHRTADRIRLAALVHDIGMIAIEDRVLKNSGLLLAEEFEILKAHPVKGASLLRPVESLRDLIPGVELHHESLDGRGYPYGLEGDEIPLMARIIAVTDAFDAMTTSRPYQSAMPPPYVLEILSRLAGIRYDSKVVAALEKLVLSGVVDVETDSEREMADAHAPTEIR